MLKDLQDRRAQHVEAIKAEMKSTIDWATRGLRTLENNPRNLPGTLTLTARRMGLDRHITAVRTIDDTVKLVETGKWPEHT